MSAKMFPSLISILRVIRDSQWKKTHTSHILQFPEISLDFQGFSLTQLPKLGDLVMKSPPDIAVTAISESWGKTEDLKSATSGEHSA